MNISPGVSPDECFERRFHVPLEDGDMEAPEGIIIGKEYGDMEVLSQIGILVHDVVDAS